VVTGFPGTGKSLVIREIVRRCGSEGLLVCALTGKACANLVARGVAARTIHSALYNPDPAALAAIHTVVVEEVSMVNVELLLTLLSALPNLSRLVLVGDADQLPPIEGESVLHLALGFSPTTVTRAALTHVYRDKSATRGLAKAASDVRNGQPITFHSAEDMTTNSVLVNAPFGREKDDAEALETAVIAVVRRLKKIFPRGYRDAQFVAYTNADVRIINNAVKKEMIPDRPPRGFVVGDRLCFRENRRHGTTSVCNGQIGTIDEIVDVVLPSNSKKKRARCPTTSAPSKSKKHCRFVGLKKSATVLEWKKFQSVTEFGYAITVHRAQGAEAPIVVFVMPRDTSRLSKRLLYTALTRASKRFLLLGDASAFNAAV
jgi:exodeoxyribonuclease V alpha subunit